MKGLLLTAIITLTGTAALSQQYAPGCNSRDVVTHRLQSKYSEHMVAGGISGGSDGETMLELWASIETGTYTVIVTDANGTSCVRAAGTDFFTVEPVIEKGKGA